MNTIPLLKRAAWSLIVVCIIPLVVGCATIQQEKAKSTLIVSPAKTVLSPLLIKKPIMFSGSGFSAKEIVVIELLVPKGVKVKGLGEGEDRVGIASGNSDENGCFKMVMEPIGTMNTFFQVGWTPLLKPDFKEARPLQPGKYEIMASGMDSGRAASATFELLMPPKEK